jgi:hypothetical protein
MYGKVERLRRYASLPTARYYPGVILHRLNKGIKLQDARCPGPY